MAGCEERWWCWAGFVLVEFRRKPGKGDGEQAGCLDLIGKDRESVDAERRSWV